MNADARLKELLREGDPGARVSPFALRRVEARLLERTEHWARGCAS